MQHTKMAQVPATERQVVERVTCDLCHAEIKDGPGLYGFDEVTILHDSGSRYPDSGESNKVSVDMCSECFHGNLVPWLRAQGAEPRTEHSDW